MKQQQFDYVIIGSGIAGLYAALLARKHGRVLIITKSSIEECNTRYAQGGIAAAISPQDSPELHFKDTIAAGDGLSDEEAVRILVTEAPQRIAELVSLGVPFDTQDGEISLGREAAHSLPRILHAGGDSTGQHIEVTLSKRVRAARIPVREFSLATQVYVEGDRVRGVRVLNADSGEAEDIDCRYLIMATGGAGQLFKFNTNPEVATGDGVALAFSAGAEVTDMEFFQFHPTALRIPGVTPFLISEAVRGEGGILRNVQGRSFMRDYTPEGELAPRDVVARSIVYEMQKTGADKVFLDVTHLPASTVTTRFPTIYRFCLDHSLDITKDMIPVAPAAHYMIGGVRTDHWGATSIAGLFACGETACPGVHGANRLASNSLLDALVFSKRIVDRTVSTPHARLETDGQYVYHKLPPRPGESNGSDPGRSALQELLWDKVGIIRDGDGLAQAAETLADWERRLPAPIDRNGYELAGMITMGRLMAEAALLRQESRGAHFRTDFPDRSPAWRRHVVFTR